MDRALIVVAKRPTSGQTKTRLTPPLSPDQAVSLYSCLLMDTLDLMSQVENVKHVIAYAPDTAAPYFQHIAPNFQLYPQHGQDLGERLHAILSQCLRQGCRQAVVMDSDSPTLPVDYLQQAFTLLDDPAVDVVLGPCDDGGYYLIGLKQPCASLFNITMSTATVAAETLTAAAQAGLRVALLPTWYDVDTVQEVARLQAELDADPTARAPRTRAWLMEHYQAPAFATAA